MVGWLALRNLTPAIRVQISMELTPPPPRVSFFFYFSCCNININNVEPLKEVSVDPNPPFPSFLFFISEAKKIFHSQLQDCNVGKSRRRAVQSVYITGTLGTCRRGLIEVQIVISLAYATSRQSRFTYRLCKCKHPQSHSHQSNTAGVRAKGNQSKMQGPVRWTCKPTDANRDS